LSRGPPWRAGTGRSSFHARRLTDPIGDPSAKLVFLDQSGGDGSDHAVRFLGSPAARVQRRPLRSANSRIREKAARLLPSGSGWFFTRCQPRTATFVPKSTLAVDEAEVLVLAVARGELEVADAASIEKHLR